MSLFILGLKSVVYKIKVLKIKMQVKNKKYKLFLKNDKSESPPTTLLFVHSARISTVFLQFLLCIRNKT